MTDNRDYLRAWWAAFEKGIEKEFNYIHIELGANKPKWYSELNPSGTVPFVVDDGKPVFESVIVAEYFEDKYKNQGTTLLPADAHQRSVIRFLIANFGEKVTGLSYTLLKAQDPNVQEETKTKLRTAITNFNSTIKSLVPSPAGPYLAGEFSLADIAIVPFIDRFAASLKFYRNFEFVVDDESHDRLVSSFKASQTRPGFQSTSQSPEFYNWVYEPYASGKV